MQSPYILIAPLILYLLQLFLLPFAFPSARKRVSPFKNHFSIQRKKPQVMKTLNSIHHLLLSPTKEFV